MACYNLIKKRVFTNSENTVQCKKNKKHKEQIRVNKLPPNRDLPLKKLPTRLSKMPKKLKKPLIRLPRMLKRQKLKRLSKLP
jgi:hypothetical protein